VVEEKVDIGIDSCFVAGGRTEYVEMLDAEPLQLGLVLLEQAYGRGASLGSR